MTDADRILPEFKFTQDALDEEASYTVEMGDQRFTQAQWELIQLYAEGYHRAQLEVTDLRPLSLQGMVQTFHKAMGQPVGTVPHPLPVDRVPVRVELIREEFIDELIPALTTGDMVETADACVDIIYVTLGLLVEMGIKVEPLFAEVQRSNMSKFGENGEAIIAGPNDPDGVFEGRVKKGPNYSRPDLKGILLSGAADLG